ncbi:MAG: glycosyltransferase family 39 protein [Candidatus Woesearchaeota archaeon]|nr:glycosyltransferase family 39 protein [Candidatus Woesearchaeota archaeon]
MKQTKTKDILVFLFLLSFVFLLKYDTFNYPFFWDELGVDIPSAIWSYDNHLSPFIGEKAMGHPPVSYIILAIFFKIFGISIFSARLAVLLATAAALFYIFKIGEHIYDTKLGMAAAITSFLIPIFFSQSGLAMSTTFMIPFAFITIYYFLKKNILIYSISATLLIMTRELGVLLVFLLTSLWIFQRKANIKTLAVLSIPLVVFIIWTLLNKYLFGWYIYIPTAVRISSSFLFDFRSRIFDFFSQYRILLLIPFIFIKQFKPEEKTLYYILMSYVLFHSFFTFLPRYFTFLYPLLVIISFGIIYSYSKKIAIPFFLILSILFIFSWNGQRSIPPGWMLETNMEYADIAKTHAHAARFIEQNYPDKRVLTCWPMSSELSDPNMGYVSSAIDIVEMQNMDEGFDIVYFSRQSNCYNLFDNMDATKLEKAATFESNGKSADVYKKI